jgi:hypothetical protein
MSSSGPANRPVRHPPPDLANQQLPRSRQIARKWFRVHSVAHQALYFSLNPAHRYSHPSCPCKILYVAIDPETCLFERFGDTLYDQRHHLPRTLWDSSAISTIDVPPFHLCDLSTTTTRAALTVDLAALMSADISLPQEWGLAIQNHPSQVPAIKFRSRFTNRACLAIFERPGVDGQLKESLLGHLNQYGPALEWLTKYEVALV